MTKEEIKAEAKYFVDDAEEITSDADELVVKCEKAMEGASDNAADRTTRITVEILEEQARILSFIKESYRWANERLNLTSGMGEDERIRSSVQDSLQKFELTFPVVFAPPSAPKSDEESDEESEQENKSWRDKLKFQCKLVKILSKIDDLKTAGVLPPTMDDDTERERNTDQEQDTGQEDNTDPEQNTD